MSAMGLEDSRATALRDQQHVIGIAPPALLQVMRSGLATPEPPRREITYTPVYLPSPREPSNLRSDPGETPPAPRPQGAKGSVDERYGF